MRIATALAGLLLAACGGAPKDNYYTLTGPEAAAPAAAASTMAVFVGPVIVPEGVDRAPMVIRKGPHQVDVDDSNRWAEPLKHAIPRVLSENLMRELGTPRVSWSRIGSAQPADVRIAVDVQRFDSSFEQGASLDAAWVVTPAKGAARNGRASIQVPAATKDPAGIAAAHSKALERLAKEIAAAVR